VATGTTIFGTVQDTLSLPELEAECILAALYGSPVRQIVEVKKVTGTYRDVQSRIAAFDRAKSGTETSVPISYKLEPGTVTADPVVYEIAASDTKLARLTSKYDIVEKIVEFLGDGMARKHTREFLQAIRGYGITSGVGYDGGASATAHTAVTYTPKTAVSYTDFATDGTSGTVADTFDVTHAEIVTAKARGRWRMPPCKFDGKGGTIQTQKLIFLTSPYQIREFQTGTSTAIPFYRQFSEGEKYFDFTVGEIPGMVVCELWDVEEIVSGAVTANEGGIKADLTNKYFESFVLADRAVRELVWEEETIHYHEYTDEGRKREKFTMTAFKNFVLKNGRATETGLVSAIHIPVA